MNARPSDILYLFYMRFLYVSYFVQSSNISNFICYNPNFIKDHASQVDIHLYYFIGHASSYMYGLPRSIFHHFHSFLSCITNVDWFWWSYVILYVGPHWEYSFCHYDTTSDESLLNCHPKIWGSIRNRFPNWLLNGWLHHCQLLGFFYKLFACSILDD